MFWAYRQGDGSCGTPPPGGVPPVWRSKPENDGTIPRMKHQMSNRLGVSFVRDMVKQFVAGMVMRDQAMASLISTKIPLLRQKKMIFACFFPCNVL